MRILGLVLALASLAWAQADQLDQARRLLAGSREQEVTQGTRICARINNVKAVERLLDVLNLTKPRGLSAEHYRDIVWNGLVEISDKQARARVEKELKRNRSGWVRQWCAELLGIYGDTDFAPALVKALRDKHKGVRRWAARSLGMLRYKPAAVALVPLTTRPDPYVRANALEALAWIDPQAQREVFLAAVRSDEDGGVRCALLGAVPGLYEDDVRQVSADALEDADWRPRLQAVDNLAPIRTKQAVDALVKATADGRPVVAYRAVNVLQPLTGNEPVALDAKQQKKVLKFVAAERTRGAKDIWQVLERVVSDPDIDTAYLLSSGEPDVGLYVHWNRVTRHLIDLNRFHKVVVNTVVYSERKWFRDQLEKIAQATGGRFQWFQ